MGFSIRIAVQGGTRRFGVVGAHQGMRVKVEQHLGQQVITFRRAQVGAEATGNVLLQHRNPQCHRDEHGGAGAAPLVSVDTWRGPVARAALEAGAAMINDVSGLSEPELASVCAEHGAALVLTHTRIPPKRKGFPRYQDVVADVAELLRERAAEARRRGLDDEQLVYDPGIDLAKTPAESIELLRRLPELGTLGRPLLVAVSRKDFLGALTGRPPSERDAGTLAALGVAVDGGAAILRVHEVAAARDYLRVYQTLQGERPVPADLRLPHHLRREGEAA
jgi:dihydropteroate synthase